MDRTEAIREHWSKAALVEHDTDGLRPTARDPYLQQIVDEIIGRWLQPHYSVLDVGCGDGVSSCKFARRSAKVVGIDYIPDFVSAARNAASEASLANALFREGDVRNLKAVREEFGLFDIVTTTRCLINLPTTDQQLEALDELAKCVRLGGYYITSEGWSDGLEGLNVLRQRAGLEAIKPAEFNLLIGREKFERAASEHFELLSYHDTGLYLLLSRVLQPVVTFPDPPSHDHYLNKIACDLFLKGIGENMNLSSIDFSGVYVFRRNR